MKAGMIIGIVAGSAIGMAAAIMCQTSRTKKQMLRKGKKLLRNYTEML